MNDNGTVKWWLWRHFKDFMPDRCRPQFNFKDRVVFNWVSKVTRVCFGFALLRSLIGSKNLRHFLNQSDAKLKPIVTWSRAFSRAWRRLHVFALSSDWFLVLFRLLWLTRVITLVLVLLHSLKNRSIGSNSLQIHIWTKVPRVSCSSVVEDPTGFGKVHRFDSCWGNSKSSYLSIWVACVTDWIISFRLIS